MSKDDWVYGVCNSNLFVLEIIGRERFQCIPGINKIFLNLTLTEHFGKLNVLERSLECVPSYGARIANLNYINLNFGNLEKARIIDKNKNICMRIF